MYIRIRDASRKDTSLAKNERVYKMKTMRFLMISIIVQQHLLLRTLKIKRGKNEEEIVIRKVTDENIKAC